MLGFESMESPTLHRKPQARTEPIEDLVDRVRRGLVRVPRFQRGLQWNASDVVALFDSLYRGYPIGSLLFWKRRAAAGRMAIGPLIVDAPEASDAWWVVDGQQRLTALTASLARPDPVPRTPEDDFVVYFDPAAQSFHSPPRDGRLPSQWVPVALLLDATRLTEWIFQWEHGRNEELRRVVFEAGKRIREYSAPLYIIDTEDEEPLRQVFYRINNTGKQLNWEDVHDALFGNDGRQPSTLGELADQLAELGMGRLKERRLLTCLVAFRGLDVTRTLAEHYRRSPEILRDAVSEALPVLRRVLSFLRTDAEIPHLRLLPRSPELDVLTRFFALHPEPNPRTRQLLCRWLWRTFFDATAFDERTLRRRGIRDVNRNDEEKSAQALMKLVHGEPSSRFELPEALDARAASSRLVLLALASLGPRDLRTGSPIDVAAHIDKLDVDAYVRIVSPQRRSLEMARSPANRTLHPRSGPRPLQSLVLDRIRTHGPGDPVLASHVIDEQAALLLAEGDLRGFLSARAGLLTEEVKQLGMRLAGWRRNDRPSIDYILREAGVEL